MANAVSSTPLTEAWGDWIDPQERLRDDAEFFGFGAAGLFTNIDDRSDGRFWPVYRTELELAMIRAAGRNLGYIDGIAVGALTALGSYVLGSAGYQFKANVAKGLESSAPQGMAAVVQRVIDRFLDRNEFNGELDHELHWRAREDGEALAILRPQPDGVDCEVVEPDQLRQPASPGSDMYDWLEGVHGIDCGAFVPSWSFGVLTPEHKTDKVLGYHVVYDGSGSDWDFLPVGQVQHFKRNVTRKAKRGVSDYYPIIEDMRAEAKLSKNMALGAALQASIPWYEHYPSGTTQAQVQAKGAAETDIYKPRPSANGTRTTNARSYRGGTIVRSSPGTEILPGPMGNGRDQDFIAVASYVLRRIGIRWTMPEYMISGDASNANYASTVEATSPFVKARESDQQWFGRRFHNLIWKMLKIEFDRGCFDRFGMGWQQFTQFIDVAFKAPSVSSTDPLKLAQTQQAQIAMGILSPRTAATQSNLDYDEEVKQGAKAADVVPVHVTPVRSQPEAQLLPEKQGPTQIASQSVDLQDTALNGAQITSLLAIVNQVSAGELPLATALATIRSAFPSLSDEKINAIMKPLVNFVPRGDMASGAVTESILHEAWDGYP